MTSRLTTQSSPTGTHGLHGSSWDGGASRPKAAERHAQSHAHLLPAQPSAIPVDTPVRLPMQCKLAVGAVNDPLEAEADRMAAQVVSGGTGIGATASASAAAVHRQPAVANSVPSVDAPPSVHQALHSPGAPLDAAIRSSMEPRFGRDLKGVRIHTGAEAAQSAADVQANAYTVGQDVFFAAGRYNPHSGEGKRLLAHELSHTIQQSGGAANQSAGLSSSGPAVQRDPTPQAADQDKKKKKPEAVTLPLPSDFMNRFKLTPPSLLTPPQQPSFFSPGQYSLGGNTPGGSGAGAAPTPNLYPPSLFPTPTTTPLGPTSQSGPSALPASPASGGAQSPGAAPKAPDRISLHDFGHLSVGVRFGFPDLSKEVAPGSPPSALQEAIKRGEVLNYLINGKPPSEYSIDPGKLIGAVWGIFANQIAPGVAAKIAAGLASKPSGGGPSYQLDATILFNLGSGSGPTATKTGGGAGATFTVLF